MDPQHESGGSEPHLFAADDGREYMVKASNNPQDGKIVVNELVGGLLLDYLGVNHPAPAIVELPEALLAASPGARYHNGNGLASGPSFGSEYWNSNPMGSVDPNLLENDADIAGTVVFDTWVHNHDGRQYRVRAAPGSTGFQFFPVDQGHAFAPNWNAASLPPGTVALSSAVRPVPASAFGPFVEQLQAVDAALVDDLLDEVPAAWLDGGEREALRTYIVARAPQAASEILIKYPQVTS